ncbi:MAG: hypothetical protein IIZ33_08360 [Erysipelotrichaceae bacterium]|nr:hypothetical protein [Erysipelotrichaceae bacterium]
MFVFWGDGSKEAMDLIHSILVRSTENFNWTFIFILTVVFYIYWTEISQKNWQYIVAGLSLYGVHWLYEIANALIAHFTGYPLWAVSNESTTFILLIGVCWELSMMFAVAGMISYKMLPKKPTKKDRLLGALGMALLFALVESFLAGTSNHSFIWVYKWWGVIPVFITTYIPFFLAANFVPSWKQKDQRTFLLTVWIAVALLLILLVPQGII